MFRSVATGSNEERILLGPKMSDNGDEFPGAYRRRRRLLWILIAFSGLVGLGALILTLNTYRLLTQDPTQTDEVIWTRAVAVGTGAVSTLAALGAGAYGSLKLWAPRWIGG
jgi:hypothetical protein